MFCWLKGTYERVNFRGDSCLDEKKERLRFVDKSSPTFRPCQAWSVWQLWLKFVCLGSERGCLGSGGQCVPIFGILSIGFHRPLPLATLIGWLWVKVTPLSHTTHSSHGLPALSLLPLSLSSPSCLSCSLTPSHPSVAKPSRVVSYLWYLRWLRRARGFEIFDDIMIFPGSNASSRECAWNWWKGDYCHSFHLRLLDLCLLFFPFFTVEGTVKWQHKIRDILKNAWNTLLRRQKEKEKRQREK